ncbi:hypothetical protein F53441_2892 [Fusarium austroafricanum]|uniref:AA1-like domain-containing protein n=1 Tax=Fusarium austroafricanum TaxID=2364996 RepID=A0A8H4KS04_9HYPO|nr:hypothetical protein F53441_2892 [Fusarium austroafricanum]
MLPQTFVAFSLFLSTTALPTESSSPRSNDMGTIPHSKRCDFEDGHGRIDCGFFSLVFGEMDPTASDIEVKTRLTITGAGFQNKYVLNCGEGGGEYWNSLTSELPFTVDIHPGNTCRQTFPNTGASHDGLWIKYANQFVNAPSDSRCGDTLSLGLGRRCIIAVNP